MLVLVNQVAQANSEQNGNTMQRHDADVQHPSFNAGDEPPMQSNLLR